MREMCLKDKVAVVTGGASGIGRALAHRFAEAGARVAVLDLNGEGAARVAGELPEGRGRGYACDVTSSERCQGVLGEVIREWGGVDVLVNNAGISHRSLLSETSAEVIAKVMSVNFFGAVHCTKAALPSILERKGVIAALSSVAGFSPLIGRTGYAASKHALHGFFDSLRAELAPSGVGVLLVCPSFVDTAIHHTALAGDGSRLDRTKATVGRLSQPDEVARAIVRAIQQRRRLLLPSGVSRVAWWLSRLAPGLYERLMRRGVAREFNLPT